MQTWLTWNGRPQSYKHHSRDSVLESHGTAEVGGQVPDDGRQKANDGDGYHEASPAVPVLGRRDAREHDLPEHRQNVHDIVRAGGRMLASLDFIFSISWTNQQGHEQIMNDSICFILL